MELEAEEDIAKLGQENKEQRDCLLRYAKNYFMN